MTRRIITRQLHSTKNEETDTYFARVIKYIPSDIVGAWVAISGLISSAENVSRTQLLWISFVAATIVTALWTYKQTSVPNVKPAITQVLICTGAFVVWVFALGGPFAALDVYRPVYGSLVLIFYTLLVALIVPSE